MEVTLQQLDQACGILIQASENVPMVRGQHNACMQAIQTAVAYINQERAKEAPLSPEGAKSKKSKE